MKTLLIVYHSMTGGTAQMVEAAAAGARAETDSGVGTPVGAAGELFQVVVMRAAEAAESDVLGADGFIFATPENLAAMSGQMKDFFDRTYYAALDRINGLPYAILICAGSDGRNAAGQIERIATGWRLRAVCEPIIVCTHAQTPHEILRPKHIGESELSACRALGATVAAGMALGIF